MYDSTHKNNQTDPQSGIALTLPPPGTKRWVKSRKLAVVKAINDGDISKTTAMERYDLSEEELSSWFRLIENHGPDGLRTTHLNRYRKCDMKNQPFQLTSK